MPTTITSEAPAVAASFFVRNLRAFSQALQAMLNGNIALSQQQFQSMKSLAEESAKAVADIVSAPNPKESLQKSFDTVRSSMQNAMAVTNILSEMSARNSAAAAKVIQDRTYAALDEIQALALKAADSSALVPTKP